MRSLISRLLRRLATLAGLRLVRWGEQSKVCEAGEGVAIVRLDPGEWAIITARSYTEHKAPAAAAPFRNPAIKGGSSPN